MSMSIRLPLHLLRRSTTSAVRTSSSFTASSLLVHHHHHHHHHPPRHTKTNTSSSINKYSPHFFSRKECLSSSTVSSESTAHTSSASVEHDEEMQEYVSPSPSLHQAFQATHETNNKIASTESVNSTTNDPDNDKDESTPKQLLGSPTRTCAEYLDPDGNILPKSCWIHVDTIVPLCTLDDVLLSFQELLEQEYEKGIVNLDALWDPETDPSVPVLSREDAIAIPSKAHAAEKSPSQNQEWVEGAHSVLSPFARPTGWHLKFSNRSVVNAILSYSQDETVYCSWKPVIVSEYDPNVRTKKTKKSGKRSNFEVSDSMVRFENSPIRMTSHDLMLKLSRYTLTMERKAVTEWHDTTPDGKKSPPMFVVEFASPAWARAAVRDMQNTEIDGRKLTLVQYPKQIRYDGKDQKSSSNK